MCATIDEDGREKIDLYLMRVRFAWKRTGRLKRFPLTSSDLWVPHRRTGGGEGALQRPITLFTIRTAIISWQQSEPAGFSILSARIYSPWWKKKGGTPFGQETSTKDTHNTVVAQFCGRGYAVGNMEEDFCLFAP